MNEYHDALDALAYGAVTLGLSILGGMVVAVMLNGVVG